MATKTISLFCGHCGTAIISKSLELMSNTEVGFTLNLVDIVKMLVTCEENGCKTSCGWSVSAMCVMVRIVCKECVDKGCK
jgi:hypothetical protein